MYILIATVRIVSALGKIRNSKYYNRERKCFGKLLEGFLKEVVMKVSKIFHSNFNSK